LLRGDIKKFYESQIDCYDWETDYSYWRITYSEYHNWIKKHLNNKHATSLELGCGTGKITKTIQERSEKVFGVDISDKLLRIAEKRCNSKKFVPNVCDLSKIPFKEQSFDCVVCLNTFDHVNNIEEAFSEIRRISKPDSLFLFDITSSLNFDLSRYFGYYGKKGVLSSIHSLTKSKTVFEWECIADDDSDLKIDTYRYRPRFIEELAQKCGFRIIDKKGVHVSSLIIPEKIQVESTSNLLSKTNYALRKFDKILNRSSFFQNRAAFVLYACQSISG